MKHYTFFAAGVQFRKEYKLYCDRICAGDTIMLVPEPDNKYDPGAIKLMWFNMNSEMESTYHHIGYVPKDKNGITAQAELLKFLANPDCYIKGEVLTHSPANKTWLALEIGVKVSEPGDQPVDADNTFDTMQEERMWPSVDDPAAEQH